MKKIFDTIGRNSFLQFLFFSLILILLYFPSINGGPIWDDVYRFFGQSNLFSQDQSIFVFIKNGFRWSIFNTYLLLLFKLFGKQTLYYHLSSIFLFAIINTLFFNILKKLKFKYTWAPVFLFLVMPLNVQNVAWIIQTKSLLAAMFLLISTFLYLLYIEKHKKRFLSFSILSYSVSLFCKSHFIHFPVLFIFYHLWRKDSWKLILKNISFFCLVMSGYLYFFFSGSFYEKRIKPVEKTFEQRYSNFQKATRRQVQEPIKVRRNNNTVHKKVKSRAQQARDAIDAFFFIDKKALLGDDNFIDEGIFTDLDLALNKARAKVKAKVKAKASAEAKALEQKRIKNIIKFREIFNLFYGKINSLNLSTDQKLYYNQYMDYAFLKKRVYKGAYYRVMSISQNTFYYLKKIFLPFRLSGFYSKFDKERNWQNISKIILFFTILFFYYIWFLQFLSGTRSLKKVLSILIGLSFLPVIGVVKAPFMFITPVSDHHALIGLFFFCPLIVLVFDKLIKNKRIAIGIFSIIVLTFSIQTRNYSKTFAGSEPFFKNILHYHPQHTLPYVVLGHYYLLAKRFKESFHLMKDGLNIYNANNKEFLTVYGISMETVRKSMSDSSYFSHLHVDPYYLMLHRQIRFFNKEFRDKYWKKL